MGGTLQQGRGTDSENSSGRLSLNPMAHLVDAFRAAVLGTHAPDLVGLGVLTALGLFTLLVAQRLFSVFDGVLADVI